MKSDKIVKEIDEDRGISYSDLNRGRKESQKGDLAFTGNDNQKLTPKQQKIIEREDKLKETKLERDMFKNIEDIFSKN